MKKIISLLICLVLVFTAIPIFSCARTPEGGILTVGLRNFPRSRNPFIGTEADQLAYMPIYEPLLTHHGQTGEPMALLAKTWTWDAADVSWTFNIDPKAKFSDGTPVTAEDVKWSWETHWNVAKKSAEALALTESIEVVDTRTVKFMLKEPIADYLEYMGQCYILPEAFWEATDGATPLMSWDPTEPIGSGPMMLTEYVSDSHVAFVTNPDYWMGKIYIDGLIMKYYATDEAQALALRRGDIHCMNKLQLDSQVPTMINDPNIEVYFAELNFTQQLMMNLRKAPFNILKFRQAINIAIDRNMMVDIVVQGYGYIPNQVPIVPSVAAAHPDAKWPHELKTVEERVALADALLDEIPLMSKTPSPKPAGWTRTYDGNPVEFTLLVSTAIASTRSAEVIQSSLAKVGIKINFTPESFITAFRTVYRHAGKAPLGWDLFITGAPFAPSFTSFYNSWVLPEPAPLPDGVWQARLTQSEGAGWTHPVIQGKLEQQHREMDPVARLALRHEIQELFIADMPLICLYHTITSVPYRTDVFTGWIEDMYTVLYHKNCEGYWSPYQLLALRPK